MSKYKEVLRTLKLEKNKKMPFMAKITLIAIAKETDRQHTDSIELSDNELIALVNAELLDYTLEQTKITARLFFEKWHKENALGYISSLCKVLETDMEGACKHIIAANKKAIELPADKRIEIKKAALVEAQRMENGVQ